MITESYRDGWWRRGGSHDVYFVSRFCSHNLLKLQNIFLTQGSSVMLWRHLKQTPTLDLFKNCSSLFSNQWGDQILSRQFPNFIQFYFSHKISLTNPNQNWICKSQPSTKNNPHIHQISHLQNPVIIDLLLLFFYSISYLYYR